MFYTVEGLDGSGKTTIVQYISQLLTEQGVDNVVVESYPRDEEGLFLRDLWIHQKVPPIAVLTIVLELRKRILIEQIIPALLKGKVVISDRWHDTTWAYQHTAVGIGYDLMAEMYREIFNVPEILISYAHHEYRLLRDIIEGYSTIHLDIDRATSIKRVQNRNVNIDAFEKQSGDFWYRLKRGFEDRYSARMVNDSPAARANPLFRIDANQDLDQVKAQVRNIFYPTA